MAKVKQPLLSLDARRKLGDDIVFKRQGRTAIVETRPIPTDARSVDQLSWRHMFQKVVALWHALSATEKEAWESLGRKRHMTGYAWFISQALRPNPGIYLPLQGGIMQGIINMDGYAIQDLLDPVNPQDADTEAARDAAIAAALEDCIDSHIHAWDGANWQKLLVESATKHNLRVRLYEGDDPVDVSPASYSAITTTGKWYLDVINKNYLYDSGSTILPWKAARRVPDNTDGAFHAPVSLMGYDGSNFDRLRTYGTGILKVGRAEIGLSDMRRVAVGQVKAAAGVLYWITMNPSAGLSVMELTDSLAGGAAVKYDHFHTGREAHHVNLDPPLEFSTGIFLETFTNMTSIMFGYK